MYYIEILLKYLKFSLQTENLFVTLKMYDI